MWMSASDVAQMWGNGHLSLQGAGFGFFHDMLVTDHYYIALENPMRLDLAKMATKYALGRACLAECLKFDPSRRTKIHLIPRPGRLGELRPFLGLTTFLLTFPVQIIG